MMRLWIDLIFLLSFCICQNLYNNYLLILESEEIYTLLREKKEWKNKEITWALEARTNSNKNDNFVTLNKNWLNIVKSHLQGL